MFRSTVHPGVKLDPMRGDARSHLAEVELGVEDVAEVHRALLRAHHACVARRRPQHVSRVQHVPSTFQLSVAENLVQNGTGAEWRRQNGTTSQY